MSETEACRRHGVLDLSPDRRTAPTSVAVARRCGGRRLLRIIVLVGIPTVFLWYRIAVRPPDQLVPAAAASTRCCSSPSLFFLALGLMLVGQFVDDRQVAAHRRSARSRSTSGSPTWSASTSSRTRSSARCSCSCRTAASRRRWAAGRAAACCSRAAPAPARPTPPRPWQQRPACRSCSRRPRRSSPASRARPRARCGSSSGRCARPPASTAVPSASSTSSTRSAWPATAPRR